MVTRPVYKKLMNLKGKKKKRYINPHYIPHKKTLPLSKSPMLILPLST